MEYKIVMKKVAELRPYPNNPRVNDQAIYAVANSIKEFGFRRPIDIDPHCVIVCGHTRWKAAKKLGMAEVPCRILDDLTPEQIKAFRIADNSTAELAIWDDDLLKLELDGIDFDMADFGLYFDGDEDERRAAEEKENGIPKMELRAFEHHDYLVFVFDNQHDFINAAQEFGVHRVDAGYSNRKIGIGRVLHGKELIERLGTADRHTVAQPKQDNHNA